MKVLLAAAIGALAFSAQAAEVRVYDRFSRPAAAAAMGGAGTALAENIDYIELNPAALALLAPSQLNLAASASLLPYEQSMANLKAGYRDPRFGAIAASLQQYQVAGILATDGTGQFLGNAELTSRAYGLTLAYPIESLNTSLGLLAKGYSDNYFGAAGSGTSMDAGLVTRVLDNRIAFAVTSRNIASQHSFGSGPIESSPLLLGLGGAVDLRPFPLVAALDLNMSGSFEMNAGLAIPISNVIFRAGFGSNLTLGAGFILDYMKLDYAYLFGAGGFDPSHRISASWAFDLSSERNTRAAIGTDNPAYAVIASLGKLLPTELKQTVDDKQPIPINRARKEIGSLRAKLEQLKALDDDTLDAAGWTRAKQTAVISAHTIIFVGTQTPTQTPTPVATPTVAATATPSPTPVPRIVKPGTEAWNQLEKIRKLVQRQAAGNKSLVNAIEDVKPLQIDELLPVLDELSAKGEKLLAVDAAVAKDAGYTDEALKAIKDLRETLEPFRR